MSGIPSHSFVPPPFSNRYIREVIFSHKSQSPPAIILGRKTAKLLLESYFPPALCLIITLTVCGLLQQAQSRLLPSVSSPENLCNSPIVSWRESLTLHTTALVYPKNFPLSSFLCSFYSKQQSPREISHLQGHKCTNEELMSNFWGSRRNCVVKLPASSANRLQKGQISVAKHLCHFMSAIMKVLAGQGKDFLKGGRGKNKNQWAKKRNAVQRESEPYFWQKTFL